MKMALLDRRVSFMRTLLRSLGLGRSFSSGKNVVEGQQVGNWQNLQVTETPTRP